MVRLAIVGIGGYGWNLVRVMEQVRRECDCRLVAAADTRLGHLPERARRLREAGVVLFDDARRMLAEVGERCDVVYVASGIGSHAPLLVAAAERGCHVHLEKPPAATVQEVDRMLEALDRGGRLCLVGFQAVHGSDIRFLKDRVVSGALGTVRSLVCRAGWIRTRAYYARNEWAGRLRSGGAWVLDGPATNALSHQITNMLHLASPRPCGMATPVAVRAELYAAGPVESHDTAAIEIVTAEGAKAYFLASHCTPTHFGPTITIDAERARVVWRMREGAVVRYRDGTEERCDGDQHSQRAMVANLMDAVRAGDGSGLRCPLHEARKMVLAIDAAHESSRRVHPIAGRRAGADNGAADTEHTVVDGLDAMLRAAAEQGALLSDLPGPPPWAVATEPFDLTGYHRFPQRFGPD